MESSPPWLASRAAASSEIVPSPSKDSAPECLAIARAASGEIVESPPRSIEPENSAASAAISGVSMRTRWRSRCLGARHAFTMNHPQRHPTNTSSPAAPAMAKRSAVDTPGRRMLRRGFCCVARVFNGWIKDFLAHWTKVRGLSFGPRASPCSRWRRPARNNLCERRNSLRTQNA